MNRPEINLEQYEADFLELQGYEQSATEDLERAQGMGRWYATTYEQRYLPGLRLAGIRKMDRIILQNTADLRFASTLGKGTHATIRLPRSQNRDRCSRRRYELRVGSS